MSSRERRSERRNWSLLRRGQRKNACESTAKPYKTLSLVIVLLTASILASLSAATRVSVYGQTGAVIDLYTEKTPFDGRGANQSSDAFEPQELVVLHARVTYNGWPECNLLVAFQTNGPSNSFLNLTIVGSGCTDENGTVEFSFRIPWPREHAEEIVFGEWFAIATVLVADQVPVDTLTFEVGWIIRITEMATLNSELETQSAFARQDLIVFDLAVANIALTPKWATIKVDVYDSVNHPMIHIQMEDVLFQPGKNNLRTTSQIPDSAEIGQANASASVLTAPPESGGRLYSPPIYTVFEVPGVDIAITDVALSSNVVFVGETLTVDVTVANKGNEPETFDLSTYYNSSLIQTQQAVMLMPSAKETFIFTWNTDAVNPGLYQISASAPLPADLNPSDNSFVDGTVEIKSGVPPLLVHDVAVVNVTPWPTYAILGQTVSINVTVRNRGTDTESFYVTVYYDHTKIDKKYVANLAPSDETQLLFEWNTSGVSPQKYVITGVADTVPGETYVSDNTFVDGTITISLFPPYFPPPEWLVFSIIVILAAIVGLILLFLILSLDRIRRRRRPRPTYTIVVHPHV